MPDTDPKEELREELNQLRSDIDSVKGELRKVVGSLKDVAQDEVRSVSGSAASDLHGRMEELERKYGDLRRRGEATVRQTRRRVEERPFASLLVAAGAGALVAMLFGRK